MKVQAIIGSVSVVLLLVGVFLIVQYGSCTQKGFEKFNLVGDGIYRYGIYAETGETITIDWKASDGVWAWYTDAEGNLLPARGYCFGSSGLWVSGIAEPGIAYENEPALEISDEAGDFLHYVPMMAVTEGLTVIDVDYDGYYDICFLSAFYPDIKSVNVELDYSLEKPLLN